MKRAEVDVHRPQHAAVERQLARCPHMVDACRQLAMFRKPVDGVVGHGVHQDAPRHGTMSVVTRTHLCLCPALREGVDALPLGGKPVLEHASL